MRRRARNVGVAVAVLVGALAGCDHFRVESFAGSKLLMTMDGDDAVAVTPAGQHVELWARTTSDDTTAAGASPATNGENVVRLLAGDDKWQNLPDGSPCPRNLPCVRAAFAVVLAVDQNDGCMIDGAGHLLWQPGADTGINDSDPNAVAAAVLLRIQQLSAGTINSQKLLAFVSWDDGSAKKPTLADTMALDAPARLELCTDFWNTSPFSYTGNPLQLTAPINGKFYGTVDFTSFSPPQTLGGISIVSDWSLHNPVEFWMTTTPATVSGLDPNQLDCAANPTTCRGRVLLDGTPVPGGEGAFSFALTSPWQDAISGALSIQTRLDQQPESF